jgi:hypothetical protein
MNSRFALFLSIIFHPVFVNLISFYSLIRLFPYLDYVLTTPARLFYLGFIFTSTAIVPVVYILVMKWFGQIKSVMLHSGEERRGPYMLTAAMYLMNFYLFQRLHSPALVNAFLLGCAAIVVGLLIINHFNKISIHMASFGLLTAVITAAAQAGGADVRLLLIPVLLAAGLTASARLWLNAHSTQQIILGFALGFCVMYFIL